MHCLRVVRRARWKSAVAEDGVCYERQTDALGDLRTTMNALSVFQADNNRMVNDVVTGLAAGRNNISPVDYAIIDSEIISGLGIRQPVRSDGKTPYRPANELHYDVVELTAVDLVALMKLIKVDNVARIPPRRVKNLLLAAVKNDLLDLSSLTECLAGSLSP